MKSSRRSPILTAWTAAAFISFCFLTANAAEVSVSINPTSFAATDTAQLSIQFEGANPTERPTPPEIEGLTIRPYGQSSSVRIINGETSRTLTLTYLVNATEPGEYEIPSFDVSAGDEILKTNAVKFTVLAASAIPAQPSSPLSQTPGNAASNQNATSGDETSSFIKLEIPEREREHLYVGEMAPARIKAYFPAGARVSLTSAPRPSGQGFTLHRVSEKPEQTLEEINGRSYTVLTWYAGVSLAKEGNYPVTVSIDANMAVRQKSSGSRRQIQRPSLFGGGFPGGSPFDDPFFDNFFNNSMFDDVFAPIVQKEVTLTSPGAPLDVRSLPEEGRPDDFSGAVGNFSLGSYRLPADAVTGEPRQVRVTVKGEGNFDRMSAPILQPQGAWKTYTPKTEFKPGDVASFSGSKTFEFNAIPQKGGEQKISLAFSYFDPTSGTYQRVQSPETQLLVSGDDITDSSRVASGNQDSAQSAEPDSKESPATELAPLRPIATSSHSLTPFFQSSAYWSAVILTLIVMAIGFLIAAMLRYRNRADRVADREFSRRSHHSLSKAEKAIAENNSSSFFAAAREAIQTHAAAEWNLSPQSITLAELSSRLPNDSPIIEIFRRADAEAYGLANSQSQTDLNHWNQKLKEALA